MKKRIDIAVFELYLNKHNETAFRELLFSIGEEVKNGNSVIIEQRGRGTPETITAINSLSDYNIVVDIWITKYRNKVHLDNLSVL